MGWGSLASDDYARCWALDKHAKGRRRAERVRGTVEDATAVRSSLSA